MNVVDGWLFYSADFSALASGRNKPGSVFLVRNTDEVRRWHNLSHELRESDDCHLYVRGEGQTLEEALNNANLVASLEKTMDYFENLESDRG